jgi:NAD(P)-dependent dehydrogenase (short-subunit alcohol dehydrogenase family)
VGREFGDLGAAAQRFARAGADVQLNAFGEAPEIERPEREITNQYGVRTAYSSADMSKPSQIAGMIEQANRELGRVDILVNNTGIQHTAPVQDFPDDRWDAIMAINLSFAFHATKAALPQMLATSTRNDRALFIRTPEPRDYSADDSDARIARRKTRWCPTMQSVGLRLTLRSGLLYVLVCG